MSPTPAETPAAPPTWPVLDTNERRILGVLVEKSKTTPDAYPMSINALVTGSNQKTNREPLLDLSDLDALHQEAGYRSLVAELKAVPAWLTFPVLP